MNANETLKKKWMSGDFKWEKAYPDEYACKRRCEEIAPDCGGFTYYPNKVKGEASRGSCQLKQNAAYSNRKSYQFNTASDPEVISGIVDCSAEGK